MEVNCVNCESRSPFSSLNSPHPIELRNVHILGRLSLVLERVCLHDRYVTSGVRLIEMSKPKKSEPSCNKDRKNYFRATEFVWSCELADDFPCLSHNKT